MGSSIQEKDGGVKCGFSPSSVTACGGATFPRQGGRLIGATNDTAVQSSKCQCWSLPPSGGRWLAEGQTDEGEAEGLRYFTNQSVS